LKTLLLILCLLPGVSFADSAAKAHTCRILFLNGPDSAPDKLHLFDGLGSIEVELPRMNLSKVYPLRPGPLKLSLLPTPLDDPEKLPKGAPSAKVHAEAVDFYLVLTSNPENAVAPVSMQVINATGSKLKQGGMLWYNLTQVTVGGTVGNRKLLVKPMSHRKLPPPASGNTDYPVNLSFLLPENKTPYPLCETKWRHDPRSRSLAFIIANEGSRAPRVLVFPDFRERKRKKDN
jgi:hypothetical protein